MLYIYILINNKMSYCIIFIFKNNKVVFKLNLIRKKKKKKKTVPVDDFTLSHVSCYIDNRSLTSGLQLLGDKSFILIPYNPLFPDLPLDFQ